MGASCRSLLTRGAAPLPSARRSLRRPAAAAGDAAAQPPNPDIRDLAKRAQIRLTEAEAGNFQPKINSILDWFGQLQQVELSNVVPSMHGTGQSTPLREDEPVVCADREQLLAMAPAAERDMFRVPKTVTGADSDAAQGSGAVLQAEGTAAPSSEGTPSSSGQQGGAQEAAAPAGGGGPDHAAALEALQLMDFRVGRIVSCEKHPEADSLYVEKIDVGEEEPRTIVSGLVKYIPLEQMQGRMVVILANLKPRNMRKIKSYGMVLAASNDEHTVVELVAPPEGAQPGERACFEGVATPLPDPAAPNVVEKKKLWEAAAPGMRTDGSKVASWNGMVMTTSAGPVQAQTLANARIA